jgi:hypothetical protein
MALTSPGVEVTIIDQSQYLPAPTNSVPLIVVATAQNKADASGTGVAQATTAANAGKLYQVTSQRDLVNLYGSPFFYTTSNGTPIQGYELNEYGLLAAYSTLGVTNRAYILRADIDLASLVGQTGRPVGTPDNGTYWLDTTTSTWGIYEFNQTTGKFTLQSPIVISDAANLDGSGVPLASIGAIGGYAVNAIDATSLPSGPGATYFYKTTNNVWVPVGEREWAVDWPTIQATSSPSTLTQGDSFSITLNGNVTATITVPSTNTPAGVASAINALGWSYISAAIRNNRLCIFANQPTSQFASTVTIAEGTGTVLDDLGINPAVYNQPGLVYGTSSQMPLWSSSQASPHPTGSVWIKIGSAGNGFSPVVSQFNSTTNSWINKNVTLADSAWSANSSLDSAGGKNIPAGSIYAQYAFDQDTVTGPGDNPVYFWERIATGPTVISGSVIDPEFTNGPYTGNNGLRVQVSLPGSGTLSSTYTVLLADNTNALDFVTAWSAAAIPYTTCVIDSTGALQLTHTLGGEIVLVDTNLITGVSTGLIEDAGFIIGTTPGASYGPSLNYLFNNVATTAVSPSTGSGAIISGINTRYGEYILFSPSTLVSGGSGYAVGDSIKILGSALGGTSPANDLYVVVASVSGDAVTSVAYVSGKPAQAYKTQLSNWRNFDYIANEGAPAATPANNTNWFYSVIDQVDIMVNADGQWNGYKNVNYDSSGFPTPSGSNATDPNGPIVSATAPTLQSDGTALVYGDLWIDTSDLENYPVISRWQAVGEPGSQEDQWVLIDNTDQTSSSGITFLDARWAQNGTVSPVDDPIPTIKTLLTSDYLDLDAPSPSAYPTGMLLFNTRRSGYNVKQFKTNYFNNTSFPGASLPAQRDAWVTVSGNQSNGSPYMGRKAQRAMVVQALRSVVDTNLAIRDEDNFFNLMATPNYPELQPNMVVLNADRGETGYIIGDTPLRLADDATQIQAWATNAAGATSTGEDGLVTRNTYMGLFYPSGIAPDLNGNLVAVPASHMMLRTFLTSDTKSYPWLAAAGTRRGNIDNATNIGYVDAQTGEFQVIKTRIGIRDVLYTNFINPLVFFTGIGLLNYGNKTSYNSSSALDRTNVARLIAYIRRQLTLAARPFVFEPNDSLTRKQIQGVVQSLMVDLVAKRGLYDYLVVCDESNNTPARIDRNELWIDVAVEPVKAAEFIYIPVRVLNTGGIASLGA